MKDPGRFALVGMGMRGLWADGILLRVGRLCDHSDTGEGHPSAVGGRSRYQPL